MGLFIFLRLFPAIPPLSERLGKISLLGAFVMAVSFGGLGILSGDQRALALLTPPLDVHSEASVYLEVCLL